MKTTLKREEVKQQEYPCLREYTLYKGLVVLFSSPRNGTVVHSGEHNYSIGYHTSSWDSDENRWKPFKGKVIIEC